MSEQGDRVVEPDGLSGYRDRAATVLSTGDGMALIEYREADGSRTARWVEQDRLTAAPGEER